MLIISDDDSNPAIYIVNFKPEGFVILPATKKEIPILAFSDNSSFSTVNMPLGLQEWLTARKEKIKSLKNVDVITSDDIEEKWLGYISLPDPNTVDDDGDPYYDPELDPTFTDYLTVRTYSKEPLMSTIWGQMEGYNSLIPLSNGVLPPTGCVTTAMAQVMKFHEYPRSYNWSAMPNNYSTEETAKLMRDIWYAADLKYDSASRNSYSTLSRAKEALVNTFGYSPLRIQKTYNFNTVVLELDNNRPVIFEGYSSEDILNAYGHAWVCDGYFIKEYYRNVSKVVTSREEYLRMNWGLNASYNNGFF